MTSRLPQTLIPLLLLAALSGCTARYQQMLRDRDLKIRDLYTQVAELNATNRDLESREKGARSRVDGLERRIKKALPAVSQRPDSDMARARKDLRDVADVRRIRDGRISIGINNKVTFDPGSTALKGSAGKVLKRVAQVIKRDFASSKIIVEGHTDTDPIRKTKGKFRSNRHLSAERADAVATYLVKNCGINEKQVVIAGHGPFDPLEAGRSESAKSHNRRVEIVIGQAY